MSQPPRDYINEFIRAIISFCIAGLIGVVLWNIVAFIFCRDRIISFDRRGFFRAITDAYFVAGFVFLPLACGIAYTMQGNPQIGGLFVFVLGIGFACWWFGPCPRD